MTHVYYIMYTCRDFCLMIGSWLLQYGGSSCSPPPHPFLHSFSLLAFCSPVCVCVCVCVLYPLYLVTCILFHYRVFVYDKDCTDPVVLAVMVNYIRAQVKQMDTSDSHSLLRLAKMNTIPLTISVASSL